MGAGASADGADLGEGEEVLIEDGAEELDDEAADAAADAESDGEELNEDEVRRRTAAISSITRLSA